jgi:phage-related minor tail protein
MANTFNYYDDTNGFLSRSIIVILSEARIARRAAGENFYEELRQRSADFSKLKLSIQVNDLDIDANTFMARLEKAMDTEVKHRVSEKLQAINEIAEVEDELAELRDVLKQRVNQLADKYDIELYRED